LPHSHLGTLPPSSLPSAQLRITLRYVNQTGDNRRRGRSRQQQPEAEAERDETPRLDTFLHVYCHVADTPYSRAVSSKTLLAAVARVMEPGAKVDTMTILEGEQGLQKSEAWRALAGAMWFADGLPDLHDKDAAQALNGKWFIELAELSQFQRSETRVCGG
jgi:predicted P-loop ATPase